MQESWSYGIPIVDAASAGVRDLLSIVQTNESQYFDEQKFSEVALKRELNDANVESKRHAMKRILAASSCGRDVSRLFADVVKNTSQTDLELKKLVYMYLVSHADCNRDIALLAVNSFQKDLSDHNQIIRGASLRAMTSIRALEIIQIVMVALRKAIADSSPYVRRIAAQSIPKILWNDPDQFVILRDHLIRLLNDIESCVVGVAVMSFVNICINNTPNGDANSNLIFLHKLFRRLCHFAPQIEALPQVSLIDLLLRYAHAFFIDPVIILSELREGKLSAAEQCAGDFQLLLNTFAVLLRSQTIVVAITACAAIMDLIPSSIIQSAAVKSSSSPLSGSSQHQITTPGTKLLLQHDLPHAITTYLPVEHQQQQSKPAADAPTTTTDDIRPSAVTISRNSTSSPPALNSPLTGMPPISIYDLLNKVHCTIIRCLAIASDDIIEMVFTIAGPLLAKMPDIARTQIQTLIVLQRDSIAVKKHKLKLLVDLCNVTTCQFVLRELRSYLFFASEPEFTVMVFQSLAALALKLPSIADGCLRGLINILDVESPLLAAESVVAVRTLLQQRTKNSLGDNTGGLLNGTPSRLNIGGKCFDSFAPPSQTIQVNDNINTSSDMGPIVLHLVKYLMDPKQVQQQQTYKSDVLKSQKTMRTKWTGASSARASVIWIVGYYHTCPGVPHHIILNALRVLAQSFETEADEVKLQIMSFAMRIWGFHFHNKTNEDTTKVTSTVLQSNSSDKAVDIMASSDVKSDTENFQKGIKTNTSPDVSRMVFPRIDDILRYLLKLASRDSNYDIQDMSRTYGVIIDLTISHNVKTEQHNTKTLEKFCAGYLKKMSNFTEDKMSDTTQTSINVSVQQTQTGSTNRWILYSLANVINEPFDGYVPLPPFSTSPSSIPPSSVRNILSPIDTSHTSSIVSVGHSSKNASAPEETVPSRRTNIPKMAFTDDLDSFYSNVTGSDLWNTTEQKDSQSTDMNNINIIKDNVKRPPQFDVGSTVIGEDESGDEEM